MLGTTKDTDMEPGIAAAAFEKWITIHTLENRTLKEMWLAGYFQAIEDGIIYIDTVSR